MKDRPLFYFQKTFANEPVKASYFPARHDANAIFGRFYQSVARDIARSG
jgi:hypothetical protein